MTQAAIVAGSSPGSTSTWATRLMSTAMAAILAASTDNGAAERPQAHGACLSAGLAEHGLRRIGERPWVFEPPAPSMPASWRRELMPSLR